MIPAKSALIDQPTYELMATPQLLYSRKGRERGREETSSVVVLCVKKMYRSERVQKTFSFFGQIVQFYVQFAKYVNMLFSSFSHSSFSTGNKRPPKCGWVSREHGRKVFFCFGSHTKIKASKKKNQMVGVCISIILNSIDQMTPIFF